MLAKGDPAGQSSKQVALFGPDASQIHKFAMVLVTEWLEITEMRGSNYLHDFCWVYSKLGPRIPVDVGPKQPRDYP